MQNKVNTNFTFYKFINQIIKAFTHLIKKKKKLNLYKV